MSSLATAPILGASAALERARRAWRPPPDVPASEWLDQNYVPSETQGFWKTLPFQRGIANAIGDIETENVTVLKSARVGFTKLTVGCVCRRIATDPGGILIVQPAEDDATEFSKDDIAPAIEATPIVAGLVGDPKSRDSDNTILHKRFPGGFLKVIGAHSGRGFRRITADMVIFEEVDAYPPSAGSEGDQIELGKKRAHTAAFPKFVAGSSPKLKATSRIWPLWEQSDQRDYIVPCPRCDHGQRLQWGGREFDFGVKWPDGCPSDAYYLCIACRQPIQHHELGWMVEEGDRHQGNGGGWVATRPHIESHAGFRIWAGYSPFPKAAWGVLAEEWLSVQDDPLRLQVFVNTVLGEPYTERGRSANHGKLYARREPLPSRELAERAPDGSVLRETLAPPEVIFLTSMTDVQLDRLEVGIEGWGVGEENWKLEYHVLYGDPTAQPVWEELWDLLRRPRAMQRGGVDYIRSSCVDSGYAAQSVYGFVRGRSIYRASRGAPRAYLWATKGMSGTGTVWPKAPPKTRQAGVPIYPIHVDAAKDEIFARINLQPPGPRTVHFGDFLTEDYFRQLTAEHALDKRDRKGFPVRVYEMKEGHRRNEALDIAVGNFAALCALYSIGLSLERMARRARTLEPPDPGSTPPATPAPPSAPPPQSPSSPASAGQGRRGRRVIRSSWMGG